MLTVVIVIAVACALFHLDHAHANYRYGRARDHRGVNLFWSSTRGSVDLRSRVHSAQGSSADSERYSSTVAIGGRNAWTTSERVR